MGDNTVQDGWRCRQLTIFNLSVTQTDVWRVVRTPLPPCNSTCGMYLSLALQHGIIGIDIHEVYFNNSIHGLRLRTPEPEVLL